MPERLHVLIEGRVQGVGFRYAAADRAAALGLAGWVRNLPDGRVEAEFDGDRAALDQMLAWCGRGPAIARVDQVEAAWSSAATPHSGIRIRHA